MVLVLAIHGELQLLSFKIYKMKKDIFYKELAEYLEFENIELKEDTNLNSISEYDSLAQMSIIAFIDEKFNIKLSAEQLRKITTIKSLMKLIGINNFE